MWYILLFRWTFPLLIRKRITSKNIVRRCCYRQESNRRQIAARHSALMPDTTPLEQQTCHFKCHHHHQRQMVSSSDPARDIRHSSLLGAISTAALCSALLCSVMCQPPSHVVYLSHGVVTDRLAARGRKVYTFISHSLPFPYAMP